MIKASVFVSLIYLFGFHLNIKDGVVLSIRQMLGYLRSQTYKFYESSIISVKLAPCTRFIGLFYRLSSSNFVSWSASCYLSGIPASE